MNTAINPFLPAVSGAAKALPPTKPRAGYAKLPVAPKNGSPVPELTSLKPGRQVAILMGDYSDRDAGYVPLVFWTKYLAFKAGLRQHCTDIIRFSHGASSGRKVYRSKFIPGLHDVCMVFEKPEGGKVAA